jgi:hypothetical protein
MGRFPITSNCGHAYLVIFYIYNANFIASVPIRTVPKKNSSKPTRSHTSIYPVGASNRNYTKWTTKHQKMSKNTLNPNALLSSTHRHTSIEPTLPNTPSAHGRTTSPPDCKPTQNLSHRQLVSPNKPMGLHDQHALSLSPESTPLGIQSHGGFLLV